MTTDQTPQVAMLAHEVRESFEHTLAEGVACLLDGLADQGGAWDDWALALDGADNLLHAAWVGCIEVGDHEAAEMLLDTAADLREIADEIEEAQVDPELDGLPPAEIAMRLEMEARA